MKPILFNTAMVRAILDGRKTVTRRLVKPQPDFYEGETGTPELCDGGYWCFKIDQYENIYVEERKPPYNPGDILYVRETWCAKKASYPTGDCEIEYKAGGVEKFDMIIAVPTTKGEWKPSIHMPKEAARIFLRVTKVSVERLQEIMDDPPGPNNQVVREGCKYGCDFIALWDSTIKEADKSLYGWDANPWVWVIEFERITREEAYHEIP